MACTPGRGRPRPDGGRQAPGGRRARFGPEGAAFLQGWCSRRLNKTRRRQNRNRASPPRCSPPALLALGSPGGGPHLAERRRGKRSRAPLRARQAGKNFSFSLASKFGVWEGRDQISAGREELTGRRCGPPPPPHPPQLLTEEPFTKGRSSWERRGRNAASVSNFLLNMAALTHDSPGVTAGRSLLACARSPALPLWLEGAGFFVFSPPFLPPICFPFPEPPVSFGRT